VHVPGGVVVAVDRGRDVDLPAAGHEVAGGAEDGISRVVRVGNAVPVRVDSPAGPGRRHELHPPDRAGRARAEVAPEVRLDLVDGAEYFPGDAVRAPGRLPDAAEVRERDRSGLPDRERDRRTARGTHA